MNEKPIIEITGLGKKYTIAHFRGRYVSLRDVIANVFKNPFRFATHKIKSAVGMTKKEEFWALRNVNLSVKRGEVVGIIGHNGAGKSTLLKILTGITPPTEGEIVMRGTVSSLLEVGTGFHPELTGRENVFLNGAILGMRKKEIEKKFDEIVEFAGVEKFLDTPVKFYSSGMYVRLAFSVAAHMEPDILLVDEVLAVGDAEFQKKCLGKMDEITKKEGRTILFVSHNMTAIQQICTKCVVLKGGVIQAVGAPKDVIADYLNEIQKSEIEIKSDPKAQKEAAVLGIRIKDAAGNPTANLRVDKPFSIEIDYELREDLPAFAMLKLSCDGVSSNTHLLVSHSNDKGQNAPREKGRYRAIAKIEPLLNAGTYSLTVSITTDGKHHLHQVIEHNVLSVKNEGRLAFETEDGFRTDSIIAVPLEWKTERLGD